MKIQENLSILYQPLFPLKWRELSKEESSRQGIPERTSRVASPHLSTVLIQTAQVTASCAADAAFYTGMGISSCILATT